MANSGGPHVVFDMDGVLLDSEPIYMSVEGELLRNLCGGDMAAVIHKLLGRTSPDTARILIEEFNLDMSVERYLELRNEALIPAMKKVEIFPGVERLVRHLKKHDVRMAIATSSPRVLLEAKQYGKDEFFALFDALVCGDDVKNGKPDPEIFLKAAERMRVDPQHCIVFEDAPAGAKAAKAAGMKCVSIPNPDVDRALYDEQNPDLYIKSFLELAPEALGLPPFDD